jgi:hypothetical protein
MLTSVKGKYHKGQVELLELPDNVPDETPVIVTFMESTEIDLKAHGIDEAQAAELGAQLAAFDDWNNPEMDVYDNYDASKSKV